MEERRHKDDNDDKRNFKQLFFGLNTYNKFKNSDVSEEDQEKRELLIKVKKTEFRKNPNYHISSTSEKIFNLGLTVRNLNKNTNEEKIKELFKTEVDNYINTLDDEKKNYYNKVKKIKQIKLLRDEKIMDKENKPKSKV